MTDYTDPPSWENGQPPARNATNLNKYSNNQRNHEERLLRQEANTLDGVSWPSGGGDIPLNEGPNVSIISSNSPRGITIAAGGGSATGMTTVSTVALLKATTDVGNGEHRYLAGYHAANGGGGGVVRRNTALSAFNEGTTFDHDTEAGGWERNE